ncbi:putative transposase, Ptta/En/Spm, plant [Sesbania bispinosa]|nr:putative transposase, Ptta/En/Spm, plant [Sesbania bispinosa]
MECLLFLSFETFRTKEITVFIMQRTSSPPPHPTPPSLDPPQHTPPSPNSSQPSQLHASSPPPEPTPLSPGNPLIGLTDSVTNSTDSPSRGLILVPSSGGSPVENDSREVISVEAVSNPRRFIPQTVTRDIISTVIMQMPTPVERWKYYPVDMKNTLFKDFMDKYQFESDYDRKMARTVWERTCMDRYPDYLKNLRKLALKRAKSTNLADTKGHGPKGMKTGVWDGLVDIWLTPEWRKKSDAGQSNKAAKPNSVYTGGSISFSEHKKRMEAEMKHPISSKDVYDRFHKTKDGVYVSQCSKKFIDRFIHNTILKKYEKDSSRHPMVDPEVKAKVSGPNKKRRVPEGQNLDIDIHDTMHTSSSKVDPSCIATHTQEVVKEAGMQR